MSRDRLSDFRTISRPGEGHSAPQMSQAPQPGLLTPQGFGQQGQSLFPPQQQQQQQQQQPQQQRQQPPRQPRPQQSRYEAVPSDPDVAVPRVSDAADPFNTEIANIRADVDRAMQNVERIRALHRQVLGSFGSEEQRLSREIAAIQTQTDGLLSNSQARLRVLANETGRLPKSRVGMRPAHQTAVVKQMVECARLYHEEQQEFKRKYREQLVRQIGITRPDATQGEIERAVDSGSGSVFVQELLGNNVREQRRMLEEAKQRNEELVRLEKSIVELAELFQQMQLQIESQEETIITISGHVEDTDRNLVSASTELDTAIVHAGSARKRAWMLAGIITLIIVIIAVVIYLNRCRLLNTGCAPSN
ncbi:hypothetical protein HK105_203734 [Polyrhizophydium stewartii]|uniref:t-SNARE coiled-coil homology domain-containing protein n=1 Tax=Polyrhizophydium stewartii TaxID=2732419 RepID=A0ABR4NAT6_9FUNG